MHITIWSTPFAAKKRKLPVEVEPGSSPGFCTGRHSTADRRPFYPDAPVEVVDLMVSQ